MYLLKVNIIRNHDPTYLVGSALWEQSLSVLCYHFIKMSLNNRGTLFPFSELYSSQAEKPHTINYPKICCGFHAFGRDDNKGISEDVGDVAVRCLCPL